MADPINPRRGPPNTIYVVFSDDGEHICFWSSEQKRAKDFARKTGCEIVIYAADVFDNQYMTDCLLARGYTVIKPQDSEVPR